MLSQTIDRLQDAAAAFWRFLTVPARLEGPGMAAWPRLDALDDGAGRQDEPHDRPAPPDYGPPTTRLDALAACRAADYFEDWRHLGPDVREHLRDAVRDWLPQIDALDPLRHPLPGEGLGHRLGHATTDQPESPGAAPQTAESASAIAPEPLPSARQWRQDDAARLACLMNDHGTANADEWPNLTTDAPDKAPAPTPPDERQTGTGAQHAQTAPHAEAYCPACDAWHVQEAYPRCGKRPIDPFPVTVNPHAKPESRPSAAMRARHAIAALADRWHERQAIAGHDLIAALQHIAAALPRDADAAPAPRRDAKGRFTHPD